MLAQLEGLGYGTNRSARALLAVHNTHIQDAVDWIMQHEDDAHMDAPLSRAWDSAASKSGKGYHASEGRHNPRLVCTDGLADFDLGSNRA